jgi:hypothetical protein
VKKFLAILLVLLIAGYIYWPYHTVGELEKAIRNPEQATIEKLVDFPAVRASLKAEMSAKRATAAASRSVPASGFTRDMLNSVTTAAELMTDKFIDTLVTPENITQALKANAALQKDSQAVDLAAPSWTGLNTCTVSSADKKTRLKLKLAGLDGWRVVAVESEATLLPTSAPKAAGR